MINEFVSPKNILVLGQPTIYKKKNEYSISVKITLKNGNTIENEEEITVQIADYDTLFFYDLVNLNRGEIEKFKQSKKFIRRV